jgi:hypothetical protein
MHSSGPPLAVCEPWMDVHAVDGRFLNRLTGSEPAMLHFNGGGKDHHLRMESEVSLTRSRCFWLLARGGRGSRPDAIRHVVQQEHASDPPLAKTMRLTPTWRAGQSARRDHRTRVLCDAAIAGREVTADRH